MRLFIKLGTKDKLVRKSEEGGGFVMAEVMITTDFELMVPDPEERKYWLELHPSWDTQILKVNAFEGGCLMGLITQAEGRTRLTLDDVWKQLVALKKAAEQKAGVTKEILPGGMIRIKDKDGNVVIRAPLPYEVEGN